MFGGAEWYTDEFLPTLLMVAAGLLGAAGAILLVWGAYLRGSSHYDPGPVFRQSTRADEGRPPGAASSDIPG